LGSGGKGIGITFSLLVLFRGGLSVVMIHFEVLHLC
jgi:hypothetical protein